MNVISIKYLKSFPSQSTAIHWFDRRSDQFVSYTYAQLISDAIDVSNAIRNILSLHNINRRVVVAIVGEHSPFLFPSILGTLDSENIFCCLDSDVTEATIQKLGVDLCLTMQSKFLNFHQSATLTVFQDFTVDILSHPTLHMRKNLIPSKIMYCVATSGTTGEPKVVQVPVDCIWPNIENLSKTFKLHKDDVVYVSAPPTFDPFIVDIFMALSVGASILITDNRLRICRQELLAQLFPPKPAPHCPTFMQITPSLFSHWSLTDIQSKVLSPKSTLRTLVLGGEPFPAMSTVKQWQDWQSPTKKRVFNIYGITEISCWALLYEIQGDEQEAPLGGSIDSVDYELVANDNNETELILKSSHRKCLVDDEDSKLLDASCEIRRATGDLVDLIDDKIFFQNRIAGAFVKRFGQRTSLHKIERAYELHPNVQKACCILHNKKIILFYTTIKEGSYDERQLRAESQKSLFSHEIPDQIMCVDQFPLSAHGKISKKKLLVLLFETKDTKEPTPTLLFLEAIKDFCGMEINVDLNGLDSSTSKRPKTHGSSSFLDLGGSSMKALQIVTKIQDAGYQCPALMGLLLNSDKVIADILAYLKSCSSDGPVLELQPEILRSYQLSVAFRYDLMKCIDASPTLVTISDAHPPLIVVGSHSHRLVALSAETGAVVSEFTLEDRIEGQATQFQETCVLVGCYAGVLYCLDLLAGKMRWRFSSGHMIKSRPLVTSAGAVVFGNYSEEKNLHCLDEAGLLLWSHEIGRKGIRAAPLDMPNNCCFVCSLDGTCGMVCTKTGATIWTLKVESPIFADPVFLRSQNLILFAEVAGLVHCIDLNGQELWTFKASGNIFSSFEIVEEGSVISIVFGCHDKHLYSLCFDIPSSTVAMKWRLPFDSQIYATPRSKENSLIVCLTNGTILQVDRNTGDRMGSLKLGGDVFSTPVIWKQKFFVGCRDNNLYCLTSESLKIVE